MMHINISISITDKQMASVGDDTGDEHLVLCVEDQEKAGGINTMRKLIGRTCRPGPTVFQYHILHKYMGNLII